MEYINLPLKIGVLDNEIDLQALKMLVPYYSGEISVIQCNRTELAQAVSTTKIDVPINHATLCTALLIEGLHRKNILDKVQITNVSITDGFGGNTLQGLILALGYCKNHNFDILSMSVGILNLLYAKQMIPFLQQAKKTVVISAAANDFSITYPAAFSTVIGVKRTVHKMKKWIEVVKNPVDGIELIMAYTETPVLHQLSNEYKLNYENSNSILVPQVCAEIAYHIIQNKMEITPKSVLRTFAKISGFSSTNPGKEYSFDKERKSSIPVVLFQYDSINQTNRYLLLKRLQEIFEVRGYSCAILCDFITKSDFENGWYRICPNKIDKEIEYYLNVTTDSVLFLLLSNKTRGSFYYDLLMEEDTLPHTFNEQEIEKLFIKIVAALS